MLHFIFGLKILSTLYHPYCVTVLLCFFPVYFFLFIWLMILLECVF